MCLRPRYLIYTAILSFIVLATWWLWPPDIFCLPDHPTPFFLFIGPALLTIGWMVSCEIAIRNSRRQHTISVLLQHAFDKHRQENREKIRKLVPNSKSKLTASGGPDFDDEKDPSLFAIDLELNFWDFIAIGIFQGDLDEAMLRRALRSQLRTAFYQYEDYIDHWRKDNDKIWIDLVKLHKRWIGH